MESSVKQEIFDEAGDLKTDTESTSCSMSRKVLKLQEIFAKHIQLQHLNKVYDSSITPSTICSCDGGLNIKIDIISKLMSTEDRARKEEIIRLCSKGSRIKKVFTEHIRERHADELRIFNELNLPMKFCLCAEGKLIQSNLIDHLMSHFVFEKSKSEVNEAEPSIEFLQYQESNEEQDFDTASLRSYDDLDQSQDLLDLPTETKTDETFYDDPPKSFVCDCCSFASPDLKVIKSHWTKVHDPANEFSCPNWKCSYRFKSQRDLNIHSREHKKSSASSTSSLCYVCSKSFLTHYQLNQHLKTHEEKRFCCDLCGSKFVTRQEVKVHVMRHKGMLTNDKIPRLFPVKYRQKQKREKKNPNEILPYLCEHEGCDRRFKLQSLLDDHTNTHLGIKPYVCQHCQESFSLKSSWRTHEKIHKDPFKNWCEICQKSFWDYRQLENHNFSHHSSSSLLPFACKYCQEKFRFKKQLLTHMNSHERVDCDVCLKSVLIRKLESHKTRYHSTSKESKSGHLKPFKCDYPGCSSSFASASYLDGHKNAHDNLRPYECDICFQRFNFQTGLKHHRKFHTNPERYRCSTCNKNFSNAPTLAKHIKLHTDDRDQRPFACSFPGCEASFKFMDSVKDHFRKIHKKVDRIRCDLCSKTFMSEFQIVRHKAKFHEDST